MNKNFIFLMIIPFLYTSDGNGMHRSTAIGGRSNCRGNQMRHAQEEVLKHQQAKLFNEESSLRRDLVGKLQAESEQLVARMSASHQASMEEANRLLSHQFIQQRQYHDVLSNKLKAQVENNLLFKLRLALLQRANGQVRSKSSSSSVGRGNDIFLPTEVTLAQKNNRLIIEIDRLGKESSFLEYSLRNLKRKEHSKSDYQRSLIKKNGSFRESGLSQRLKQIKQQKTDITFFGVLNFFKRFSQNSSRAS